MPGLTWWVQILSGGGETENSARTGRRMIMVIASTTVNLLAILFVAEFANGAIDNWEGCGGRLERALDALRRDSPRRTTPTETEDELQREIVYRKELRSAPMDMIVSHIRVELPRDPRGQEYPWARVERCVYEPSNNSLQTRLLFNDLTVSGRISMLPVDYRAPLPTETCRMRLRLRRAGIDFFTSPVARGHGQMRIRTESSFLEPRFASIYAYGCRSTRGDKQIKRQDKWSSQSNQVNAASQLDVIPDGPASIPVPDYEAAEPRREDASSVAAESRMKFRAVPDPGIWRRSDWVTRGLRKRSTVQDITPQDFAMALSNEEKESSSSSSSQPPPPPPGEIVYGTSKRNETSSRNESTSAQAEATRYTAEVIGGDPNGWWNRSVIVEDLPKSVDESRTSSKRETTESPNIDESTRAREQLLEDNVYVGPVDPDGRSWQSGDSIAREMEDVFLRGASQALASYIERQLHPAIKETLMLSMGYTISYG